jgi:hypothetical protein
MSLLKVHKVISALPSPLEADSIYIVRVGAGFDMYVTDTTGAIAYASNSGGGGTPATGDENFIAKFNALSELIESIIFDDGTHVGIGASTDLTEQLNVNGAMDLAYGSYISFARGIGTAVAKWALKNTYSSPYDVLMIQPTGSSDGIITFHTGSAAASRLEAARFAANGNFGINEVNPAEKLDVNGRARIQTIDNGAGDIITVSATGVLRKRTPSELKSDLNIAGGSTDIQVFTASGVWTKPTGAKIIEVYLVSGGGGGGSGRRGSSLVARYGGGGGASGVMNAVKLDAASLDSTENVWIGAGGTGGAAQTTNDANGNGGGSGASSFFGGTGVASTAKISTNVAVGGAAGTSTAGSGSSSNFTYFFGNRTTAGLYASGNVAPSTFGGGQTAFDMVPLLSGTIGGGISAADVRSNGQGIVLRGAITSQIIRSVLGGNGIGLNGIDGELVLNNASNLFFAVGGTGGASGSITSATGGGKGGKGGPGAGGGGGGASTNGSASGAGGNGGDGFCIVISYF